MILLRWGLVWLLVLGSNRAFALRQIECWSIVESGAGLRFVLALPSLKNRVGCDAALGLSVSDGQLRLSDDFWAEWDEELIQIGVHKAGSVSGSSDSYLVLLEPYSARPNLSWHHPELFLNGSHWPQFKCSAREME